MNGQMYAGFTKEERGERKTDMPGISVFFVIIFLL